MAWIKNPKTRKHGVVMILVLGVLVILALLATTFVRIQTTHKGVAFSFTDNVRAKLLAQSGIEEAIDRLDNVGKDDLWVFDGNDIDGDGSVVSAELDSPYETDIDAIPPIEWAKSPSFAMEDSTTGDARTAWIDSSSAGGQGPRRWGVSGSMGVNTPSGTGGTYAANGDAYSIRIKDTSSSIFLNDGIDQAPTIGNPHSTASQNLRLILNNLGEAVGCSDTTIGDTILDNRPVRTGYATIKELQAFLTPEDYTLLKDKVTTHAWVDKNVVHPVPLSAAASGDYPVKYYRGFPMNPVMRRSGSNSRIRVGKDYKDATVTQALRWLGAPASGTVVKEDAGVYGLDELFPQYIEVAWRAPVNINTASIQVIEALIADVRGFWLLEPRADTPFANAPASFYHGGFSYSSSFFWNVPDPDWTWTYEVHSYSPSSPADYDTREDTSGTVEVSLQDDYDEIGYLYSSADYSGSWEGTTTDSIPALDVAKHIAACRSAKAGLTDGGSTYQGIDYSTKHFGGPFRSWAQFYEFIDNLVVEGGAAGTGLIVDERTIFEGYTSAPAIAAQAAADALKANFNPNCHLNELNPDFNMNLLVDKTDLIRNSTEFTFRATGYFEVEALGRVLRPIDGDADAIPTTGTVYNEIRAEKKANVVVKKFDLYRETSQRHFYPGALATRQSALSETNNNMSLEVGPEPDNDASMVYDDTWEITSINVDPEVDGYLGVEPASWTNAWNTTGWGYEYDGYIQLATVGGPFDSETIPAATPWTIDDVHSAPIPFDGIKTSKPQTKTTPGDEPHGGTDKFGETTRAHFAFDDKASFHLGADRPGNDWMRDNLAANGIDRFAWLVTDEYWAPHSAGLNHKKKERFKNFKDYGESVDSPYYRYKGAEFRLVRSFRMPKTGGSVSYPKLVSFTSADLRLDGYYGERHNGIAYWIDEGGDGDDYQNWSGTMGQVSAWIKPSWEPRYTSKMRNIFAAQRYHSHNAGHRNPDNFNLMYMPAHDGDSDSGHEDIDSDYIIGTPLAAGTDSSEEGEGGKYLPKWRPISFMFDNHSSCFNGGIKDISHGSPFLGYRYGFNSVTLNHDDHSVHASQADHLKGHRWAFVVLQWYNNPKSGTAWGYHHASRNWVNNEETGGKTPGNYNANGQDDSTYPSVLTESGETTAYSTNMLSDFFNSSCGSSPNSNERYYSTMMTGKSITGAFQRGANALRLGEVSYHGYSVALSPNNKIYPRNFTADVTFDELYIWKGPTNDPLTQGEAKDRSNSLFEGSSSDSNAPDPAGAPQAQFWKGRYYHPIEGGPPTESFFISPWVDLGGLGGNRELPPATTITAPPPTGEGGGGGSTVSVPGVTAAKKRLIGVAWTWHAEAYDTKVPELADNAWGRMIPIVYDYSDLENGNEPTYDDPVTPGVDNAIGPQETAGGDEGLTIVRVFIEVKDDQDVVTQYPETGPLSTTGYLDDGYSKIVDANNDLVELDSGFVFRYKVWFQIKGIVSNSADAEDDHQLLATPYFDDITIYYDEGGPQFLSYSIQ